MKTTVELAEWLPDQAALGLPGATVASNVLPSARGYLEAPSLAPCTAALAANCIGAASFRSSANTQYLFAGTLTKLYTSTGTAWTDASNTTEDYEVASGYQWEFTQYGDRVIATAYYDGSESGTAVTFPQTYTMGTSTDFANLLTGNVTEGSNEFRAAHVATVRDFVVFGDIRYDEVRYPNRIWWTALNDPTTITVSATTQADYQDLPDTGWVRRIYGGETALVVTDRGIWSLRYVGAPVIWQVDLIVPNLGTSFAWGGTQLSGVVYLLTDKGFCAVSRGGEVRRIGAERVDRYFFKHFAAGSEWRVSCAADPRTGRIFWAYPTANAASGTSDRILVYDTQADRWSEIVQSVEVLLQAGSAGAAPDDGSGYWFDTSPDSLTLSPDSDLLKGGKLTLAGVDSAHKLGVFDGAALAATVETQEANLVPGARAFVRASRPLCDAGTATVAVGSRNRLTDSVTWSITSAQNATGVCDHRVNARYHRGRLVTSGAFGHLLGLEVEFDPAGDR